MRTFRMREGTIDHVKDLSFPPTLSHRVGEEEGRRDER